MTIQPTGWGILGTSYSSIACLKCSKRGPGSLLSPPGVCSEDSGKTLYPPNCDVKLGPSLASS